jgi:uncharacterized protein (DUF2236 family)
VRQSPMDPARAQLERHRDAVRRRLAARGMAPVGPDSVTWKINREVVVIAGWGRAILLQLAHPLVAAGVGDHSTFRSSLTSGFRRLHSTIGAMLSLTFGTEEEAISVAAGINCIHDRVSGRLPEKAGAFAAGDEYSAHDPELLRWVHATLLDSIPLTYELFVGPLTLAERDRYCVEATVIEPLLDIPEGLLPRNWAQLDLYMRESVSSGRISVSDTSRSLARSMLFPRHPFILWPAFRAMQLITIGMLPPAIREAYGFGWTESHARAFARWTRFIRGVRRISPRMLREWPGARRGRGAHVRRAVVRRA